MNIKASSSLQYLHAPSSPHIVTNNVGSPHGGTSNCFHTGMPGTPTRKSTISNMTTSLMTLQLKKLDKFHNRVAEYPFDDHNPPPLSLLIPACQDIGRTGVMICAFLLYSSEWVTAQGAMNFYGNARSLNQQGVTIPSQRRFIEYFATMCHSDQFDTAAQHELRMTSADFQDLWDKQWQQNPDSPTLSPSSSLSSSSLNAIVDGDAMAAAVEAELQQLQPLAALPKVFARLSLPKLNNVVLTAVTITGMYPKLRKMDNLRVEVQVGFDRSLVYDISAVGTSRVEVDEAAAAVDGPTETLHVHCPEKQVLLFGEVLVTLKVKQKEVGHLWFHTSFLDSHTKHLVIKKADIDKLLKDAKKGHKLFASSMQVVLAFK
ncbi:hypothetical protein DYB38_006734 [Aphanomyces astaci]|uniref:Phosphatase tensin-type domain-containing protein n=1 Tax=Aphanomyces astaci TaxID=112090 RepID=A0A397DKD9_APHAT|nr:hypothetical protein DYB38_006734 [Aphanomyces astaci]RHY81903.1 hypothetical protein DYB31_000902 [Aphanomyces astaci]